MNRAGKMLKELVERYAADLRQMDRDTNGRGALLAGTVAERLECIAAQAETFDQEQPVNLALKGAGIDAP